MSSNLNLYQRLVKVMESMGAVGKGGKTDYGERFAYHKIDDIDDKLRVALIEHGVVATIAKIESRKLDHFQDVDKYGKPRITWYAECLITIDLVNADNPEEKTSIAGWGQGLDYSDKATGKAISYAAKAAYLSAFHLRGQPDNEADNINAQPKSAVAPAIEDVELDGASQSCVDAINQVDDAWMLPPLGQKLLKEPPSVQKAVWPFYCRKWGEMLKQAETKERLEELGNVLAKEPKHVADAVRDTYKKQAAAIKSKGF